MFCNISFIFKEIETKLCNIAQIDNITVKLNLRIKQCFNFCILKNCRAQLPDFLGFHLMQEAPLMDCQSLLIVLKPAGKKTFVFSIFLVISHLVKISSSSFH